MSARLSGLEEAALQRFTTLVRAALGSRVVSITLFGSRARGEGHEESDLDLLVLVHELDLPARRTVQDVAADVGVEAGLALSPLVKDPGRGATTFRWHAKLPVMEWRCERQ